MSIGLGKIYYIMGKSASGKDTIYKELLKAYPELKEIILYTTRPIRDGEMDGREYFFTDDKSLDEYKKNGRLIEKRTYKTMYGPWSYATVDDGQVDIKKHSYIGIGTLESYLKIRDYYGRDHVLPIYITIDDRTRLLRAIEREAKEEKPKYIELCRRYIADEDDFSEDKLTAAGIKSSYQNIDLDKCIEAIRKDIDA